MSFDLVVSGGTLVHADGRVDADIAIEDGTIAAIGRHGSFDGDRVIDATDRYILPGAIDPHTHHGIYNSLADDGNTESRSDLVGGVTTIGNFFRRPGSYMEIMADYFEEAEANYRHDYFFSLGLLTHEHIGEIPQIVDDLGITSFKWYMNYKYVAKEKFGVDCEMRDDWGDAFIQALADLEVPTTLGYHSENVEITSALGDNPYLEVDRDEDEEYRGYDTLVESFPDYAEAQSMIAGAALARQHGYDGFYAVHVSAGRTADELANLKSAGWSITGETCTHYLALTTEECDERHNVNPPVRSSRDQETLWRRIGDGTISTIGTDHCANLAEEKIGDDVPDSLPGFPSTATMLPLLLSEGVNEGRIGLERVVAITSSNTAKAWNLYPTKGSLEVGTDADLVVVDLDETKTVTPELLQSSADYSPYEGREITGWPTHTISNGAVAFEDGEVLADPGAGSHIDRPL